MEVEIVVVVVFVICLFSRPSSSPVHSDLLNFSNHSCSTRLEKRWRSSLTSSPTRRTLLLPVSRCVFRASFWVTGVFLMLRIVFFFFGFFPLWFFAFGFLISWLSAFFFFFSPTKTSVSLPEIPLKSSKFKNNNNNNSNNNNKSGGQNKHSLSLPEISTNRSPSAVSENDDGKISFLKTKHYFQTHVIHQL